MRRSGWSGPWRFSGSWTPERRSRSRCRTSGMSAYRRAGAKRRSLCNRKASLSLRNWEVRRRSRSAWRHTRRAGYRPPPATPRGLSSYPGMGRPPEARARRRVSAPVSRASPPPQVATVARSEDGSSALPVGGRASGRERSHPMPVPAAPGWEPPRIAVRNHDVGPVVISRM